MRHPALRAWGSTRPSRRRCCWHRPARGEYVAGQERSRNQPGNRHRRARRPRGSRGLDAAAGTGTAGCPRRTRSGRCGVGIGGDLLRRFADRIRHLGRGLRGLRDSHCSHLRSGIGGCSRGRNLHGLDCRCLDCRGDLHRCLDWRRQHDRLRDVAVQTRQCTDRADRKAGNHDGISLWVQRCHRRECVQSDPARAEQSAHFQADARDRVRQLDTQQSDQRGQVQGLAAVQGGTDDVRGDIDQFSQRAAEVGFLQQSKGVGDAVHHGQHWGDDRP